MRTAIYGPPGTGKTHKLGTLVQSMPTKSMAVVSFSRAAAGVLTSRLPGAIKYVGTLHALAYRILGLTKGQVADLGKFSTWYGTDIEEATQSMQVYSMTHHGLSLPDAYIMINPPMPFMRVEHLILSYQNWKKEYGYIDFDDMIMMAVGVDPDKFDIMIIDEAQDLTDRQWTLVLDLLKPDGTLIAAGDDDQAIFTWAGANPHAMQQICDTYEVLDQSWRLPKSVHRLAESTVKQIKNRFPKIYSPTSEEGIVQHVGHYHPLKYPEAHTVLCRDKWVLAEVEAMIIEYGIPYICTGRSSGQGLFSRSRARLIQAIINEDLKRIGKLSRYLQPQYRDVDVSGMDWRKVVDLGKYDLEAKYLSIVDHTADPVITLSTIHGFKGEEDDHIVIMGDCAGRVESAMDNPQSYDNEIRVWYVALTRSRKQLTFIGWNSYVT